MAKAMPDTDAGTLAGAIGVLAGRLALRTSEPVDVLAVVNRAAGAVINGELAS